MLRRPAERILINSLTDKTVVDNGTHVIINGIAFPKTQLIETKCTRYCNSAGVEKVVTVSVDLPVSACGCIEEWSIKVKCHPNGSYDLQNIRPNIRTYDFSSNGGTPTGAQIAEEITNLINTHQPGEGCVTATWTAGNTFTLTGEAGVDFEVFFPLGMGSVTVVTDFEKAILTADDMAKLFPINFGSFGSRPQLPTCGTYCKYVLHTSDWTQDLAHSLGYLAYTHDIEFYVNNADANFAAYWSSKLDTLLGCTNCSTVFALNNQTGDGGGDFTSGIAVASGGAPLADVHIDVTTDGAGDVVTPHVVIAAGTSFPSANTLLEVDAVTTGETITIVVQEQGCPAQTFTYVVPAP